MLHEVLMTVAQTHPHLFVRNGVTYNCIELMANTLWDYMVKDQKGVINLRVLAHVNNLVPYVGEQVLKASSEDLRLFISSIWKSTCKAVCLKTQARSLVADMIVKV